MCTVAHRELAGFRTVAPELVHEAVDAIVQEQALIQRDDTMGAAADKAQAPFFIDSEARMVAVAERRGRGEGRLHRRVRKLADAAELIQHHLPLEIELAGIGDVLPLTAAALSVVRDKAALCGRVRARER